MAEHNRFSVESSPTFTPFWHRLPSFFLYPLQTGSIMRIAGYSVFGGISMFIPSPFDQLLRFVLWIVFLKYAFVVMERTANGQFDEPNNLDNKDEGDAAQVMRQFGLFLIFGAAFGLLVAMFGKVGYGLGWLLMNIAPPAGIMIIAVSRSFWQALNPLQILFFIKTIGSPYLALCFLLLSLTGSGAWLQYFLFDHMDSWLVLPLLSFVEFYFALITYHMMGYAIYQYHEELGVHADVSFEKAEAQISPNKVADPFLTKLGTLIAAGKDGEAVSLLREELRINWGNNDLHERYQRLLVAVGKQDSALQHAREFIAKLVTEKRLFQALDLCEQSLKADPEFQLQNPDHVHELATAASLAKRPKLALDLMRRFDKRYPEHAHIPPVYLLSAKILNEQYRMHKEAAQIMRTLQAKFPDHALASEARQYLEAITTLNAAS